jgi:hypothetical protein
MTLISSMPQPPDLTKDLESYTDTTLVPSVSHGQIDYRLLPPAPKIVSVRLSLESQPKLSDRTIRCKVFIVSPLADRGEVDRISRSGSCRACPHFDDL